MPSESTEEQREDIEAKNTLSRNVAVSVITKFFYFATRLFIPPFILQHVPLSEYGIWSYCFIILGYLGMSVFGVTNVYIRYGALYSAEGDIQSMNKLMSTGLIFVSTLCLVLVPFFWFFLPLLYDPLKIPQEYSSVAFVLLFGTTLIFMLDLSAGVFGYVLESLRRIVVERIIWTITFTIETILIVVLIKCGLGVYSLLWAFFARILLAIVLSAIACFKFLPGLSIRFRHFDKSILKLFYQFGAIVQISGFLAIANRSIEKIVAGMFIDIKATALFDVGEKFPITAIALPGTINAVLLPTTAHLHAKNKHDQIVEIYMTGSRYIHWITGMTMGFLAAFAVPLISCWLGPDEKYQIAATILVFFTLPYQMDVLTGPASAIYRSINKPINELIYGLSQFVLVILALAIGFSLYGYTMMTIIVCVSSMMVISALFYLVYSNRHLKVNQLTYLRNVFIPGLVPYLCGYAILFLVQPWVTATEGSRWNTFFVLLISLFLYLILALSVTFFFISDKEERKMLKEQIRRTLGDLLPFRS